MSLPSWNSLLSAALTVLHNTSLQFLCLFGVLFLSGFVLTLISKWTSNSFRQFRFPSFGLYLFGIIGIPLHELCHALFAKIFFHQIKSIKWFDPKGKGGSYGTVVHSYNEKNVYHRIGLFFIGMGPVLLAPFFLLAAYYLFVPSAVHFSFLPTKPTAVLQTFTGSLLSSHNWSSIRFYIFLYLTVCLTSQMELSPDDFKVARGGLLPLFLTLLLMNTLSSFLHLGLQSRLEALFPAAFTLWSAWLLVAISVALINLVLCYLILTALNRLFGHENINPFQD